MYFARLVNITSVDRLELEVSSDAGVNKQLHQLS